MPRCRPKRPAGETRQLVADLRKQGLSYAEIAAEIGATKSTVAYHARRIGVPVNSNFARRYNWQEIQTAYDSGLSMGECQATFGFNSSSWSQAVVRGDIVPRPRAKDIELLLVTGAERNGRWNLKKRILEAGLKVDRCEDCGITHWNGQKLSLHLHHVNGDGTDNRLENLELLCANCHSLTDTYAGRNRHRRSSEVDSHA